MTLLKLGGDRREAEDAFGDAVVMPSERFAQAIAPEWVLGGDTQALDVRVDPFEWRGPPELLEREARHLACPRLMACRRDALELGSQRFECFQFGIKREADQPASIVFHEDGERECERDTRIEVARNVVGFERPVLLQCQYAFGQAEVVGGKNESAASFAIIWQEGVDFCKQRIDRTRNEIGIADRNGRPDVERNGEEISGDNGMFRMLSRDGSDSGVDFDSESWDTVVERFERAQPGASPGHRFENDVAFAQVAEILP